MCGIAGYIGQKKYFPEKNNINNCLKAMQLRRGPDSVGQKTVHNENYSFAFLHSRLSIIDPNPRSNQPMEDEEGILSFSGEIYNYLELKSICESKGAKFKTTSDTEVLLKMLNIFGTKAFKILDGDWAFSYYNKKKNTIVISKDRFSVKPLFYLEENNNIYFASNITHLFMLMGRKQNLSLEKIKTFLAYGFKAMRSKPDTFFDNILTFPGSSYWEIKNGFDRNLTEYWEKNLKVNNSLNYNDSVELIKENFINSMKLRLRADFPIACLLSGGIDSSAIAGVAKKKFNSDLHYFSYKPKNKNYDESEFIKKNIESINGNHKYIDLDFKDNISELRNLIEDGGIPLNSPSSFAFHRICQEVKKLNYRVLLSGLGGDELFAGNYVDHLNYLVSIYEKPNFNEAFKHWEKNIKPAIRSPILKNFENYKKNVHSDPHLTWHEKSLIEPYLNFDLPKINKNGRKNYSKDFFRNELSRCIFEENVPSHLFSFDQISMYHSVEGRFPFLSSKLFEVANSIPSDFLMKEARSKSIFRDAVNNLVPSEILRSTNKVGFYCDLEDTFQISSKKFSDLIFQSSKLNTLLNVDKFRKILSKKVIDNPEQKLVFSALNIALMMEIYD